MNLQSIIWDFVRQHPYDAIVNTVIIFLYYPLEIIVLSLLFSRVYDQLKNVKRNPGNFIKEMAILITLLICLEFMMDYRDYVNARFFPALEQSIRMNIIEEVIKTQSTNIEEVNMGDLQSRLINIPFAVSTFYDYLNKFILPFVFTIIGINIFVYFIDKRIGLFSTIFTIIYLGIYVLLYVKCMNKSQERNQMENDMAEQIDDKVRNLLNIFTTGQEDKEKHEFEKLQSENRKKQTGEFMHRVHMDFWIGILDYVYFAMMIGLTIYYRKQLTTNQITLMVTLMIFFVRHLRMFSGETLVSSYFVGSLVENNKFLENLQKSQVIREGAKKNFLRSGIYQFHNVSFQYPKSDKKIFRNINGIIEPKDFVLIGGESGSGKSTFMKLLMGFFEPTTGTITLDNVPLNEADLHYLRENITYLPQHSTLFHGSILDNIAYGTPYKPTEIEQKIHNLEVREILGEDLTRDVGKLGGNLSGGQRQIVLLLRAYLRENPIVMVDEPTASVDVDHREAVYQLLKELNKKSTLIIISHDADLQNLCKKKVVMSK